MLGGSSVVAWANRDVFLNVGKQVGFSPIIPNNIIPNKLSLWGKDFVKLYPLDPQLNYADILKNTEKKLRNLSDDLNVSSDRVSRHMGESVFKMFESDARFNSAFKGLPVQKIDTLVVGNELESVIAAVSASDNGKRKVVLVRGEAPNIKLGGLITNSGQTHLDRDFTFQQQNLTPSDLYHKIIEESGVGSFEVDISPDKLENVLKQYLKKHNIQVVDGGKEVVLDFNPTYNKIEHVGVDSNGKKEVFHALNIIDTSPQAIVFGQSGHWNYGDLSDNGYTLRNNTKKSSGILAVSPIPNIDVTFNELDALDFQIRRTGVDFTGIKSSVQFENILPDVKAQKNSSEKSKLVRSAIGSDFVKWMYETYPKEAKSLKLSNKEGFPTSIQGFNLSQPDSHSINFNGILFVPNSKKQLKDWQNKPTKEMLQLTQRFNEYLSLKIGRKLTSDLPEQLYIRDWGEKYQTTEPVTIESILSPKTNAIFTTFQYANDFRGQYPEELMKGFADSSYNITKPVYPLHINQGLSPYILNLSGVSASIGVTPGMQGGFRIQQNLSYLAELLGTRASMSSDNLGSLALNPLQSRMRLKGFVPYTLPTQNYNTSYLTKAEEIDKSIQP